MYQQQGGAQFGYIQSGGGLCLKYLAMIYQIALLVVGGVVLGFGIWMARWTTSLNNVGILLGNSMYMAGYALLIVTGIVMLIISLIGCCGTQQENSCLLLSFLIVIILLFTGVIASATLGFLFSNQIRDFAQNRFANVIEKYYGINLANAENQRLTTAMDAVQQSFRCCGAYGNINGTKSWYIYKSASPWYQATIVNFGNIYPLVPSSCCVVNTDNSISNQDVCQGKTSYTQAKGPIPPRSNPPLQYSNPFMYDTGCYNVLLTQASQQAASIGGVGIAAAVYMFIGIILVFSLLYSLEHAKFEYHHQEEKPDNDKPKKVGVPARGRTTGYRA